MAKAKKAAAATSDSQDRCPLTVDPTLRRTLNHEMDQIRDNFPHGIGRPALGALLDSGFTKLEQLTRISEKKLLAIHGIGPKAARILRAALEAGGLGFQPSTKRAEPGAAADGGGMTAFPDS